MSEAREDQLRRILEDIRVVVAEMDELIPQSLNREQRQKLMDECAHLRIAMKRINHVLDPELPHYICAPEPTVETDPAINTDGWIT
jgi:hypothetical protein